MSQDRALLKRLRRGDPDALRRIYQQHKDRLLTIATCLLGDAAAAEDCLHDVFVTLAQQARTARVNSSLSGYLAVSIANRARDQLRRGKVRQAVPLTAAADLPAGAAEPSVQAADREESARLFAALARLPDLQRETVSLHLHGRMTFREIAIVQNVSIDTAKGRYRYGLEKLRTLLKAGARP